MPEEPDNGRSEPSYSERIARLEGRLETQDKSLTSKVSQWTALVALIISIAVGVFQVYENVILRERQATSVDRKTPADYIRRISELNSKIVSMYFSTQNDWATQSLAETLNAEKFSILGLADDIVSERGDLVNFAVSYTLSSEHLQLGNATRARQYARIAWSRAATDVEKVEAQRALAGTLFAPGKGQDIPRARERFGDALKTIERMETFLKAGLYTNVYTDWIVSEAAFGDCQRATARWQEFVNKVKDEYNGVRMVKTAENQIKVSLTNPDRCRPF